MDDLYFDTGFPIEAFLLSYIVTSKLGLRRPLGRKYNLLRLYARDTAKGKDGGHHPWEKFFIHEVVHLL
jgi:hypothetical protein